MRPVRHALLWASRNAWLADRLPRYRFAQAAVRRFMPGEDLEDAIAAARSFQGAGIGTILTRLGENLTDLEGAVEVADHYVGALDRVAAERLDAWISVKPTQLGLDQGMAPARENLLRIVRHAAGAGNIVWIDMESSPYVDRTIELFRAALREHASVGLCLQAYLHRTPDDLASLLEETAAIRLVKGAYDEPAGIAYARKADVDAAFERLALDTLRAAKAGRPGPPPAIATHDLGLIERITARAAAEGIDRTAFEVQMLYGIRTAEQRRLAADGYRVRVLISYGPAWFPWYLRRLAERPANIGFMLRSMAAR
jgi:proline dehydrogenase